ncbi:hypothetical protein VIGAN_09182800 [Vigna angularis var. angularis]|uniref:Uncharacterized protein n=1 Tax=Vigna angularis var. angularis TaxID=157739 RepID=A0A0S3SZL1_PHAAN|nr:hypothetical protein VIGAN_09182800 [Vigna angularis var. angularis]
MLLRRLLNSMAKWLASGVSGSSFPFSSFPSASVSTSLLEAVLEPHEERSTCFLPFVLLESRCSEIISFVS